MKPATNLAYWFMPEAAMLPISMVLVMAGLFFWLIGFRGVGKSLLITAVGLAVIPPLLSPMMEEILAQVPPWLLVVILVALGFYLVRLILTLFLGKEGAGTLLAMAVAGALRKAVTLPHLVSRGIHQLGALMNSPSPGRRAVGMALAILLAVLAGLLGRQVADSDLLDWGVASSSLMASSPMVVEESSSEQGKRSADDKTQPGLWPPFKNITTMFR
ncbi:MAG: hypothetical protein AB2796_05250 [Candidatus Thiodiazotropha sp.]